MAEFFQWLSSNPIATIIVTISLAIFTITFVVAVFQGREISIWPPKIGPKPLISDAKTTTSNLGKNNFASKNEDLSIKYLFGYFFLEREGFEEKILLFNNPTHSYFIKGEVATDTTIEEAIDRIILRTINENGITKNDLLKAGLSQPYYFRLLKKVDASIEPTPYIFFKVGLLKEISHASCEWSKKNTITASWGDENQRFPLQFSNAQNVGEIFKKDYIHKQLDLVILECVDVLIFRINNKKQIEFLLIHRNRSEEPRVNSKDTWEYPKGGMRYYETNIEAVYRETQEETSITPDEVILCSYLGWQTIDVSKRRKPYNTLRVHGYTLYYKGASDKKLFSGEGHDDFKWVPLEQAKQEVWMDEDLYATEFFSRWEDKQEEILFKAGILKQV